MTSKHSFFYFLAGIILVLLIYEFYNFLTDKDEGFSFTFPSVSGPFGIGVKLGNFNF